MNNSSKQQRKLNLMDRLSNINFKNIFDNIKYIIPTAGLGFMMYASDSFGQDNNILAISKNNPKYKVIKTLGENVIRGYNNKGNITSHEASGNEISWDLYNKVLNDTLTIEVEDKNNDGVFNEGDVLRRESAFFYNTPYILTKDGVDIDYPFVCLAFMDRFLSISQKNIENGADKEQEKEIVRKFMRRLDNVVYSNVCEEIDSYRQFLKQFSIFFKTDIYIYQNALNFL